MKIGVFGRGHKKIEGVIPASKMGQLHTIAHSYKFSAFIRKALATKM